MKLLPTVTRVLTAGLLTVTACQQAPSKFDNVSVKTEPLVSSVHNIDRGASSPPLESEVQYLETKLRLTGQQTDKIKEIFQDSNRQREAINKQRRDLAKQMRKIQTTKLERINAILTEEQAKKYEQLRDEPPFGVMEEQPSSEPGLPQTTN